MTAPTLPSRLRAFAPVRIPLFTSYIVDSIYAIVFNGNMENEGRRKPQMLSSHKIEELRAVLEELANKPAPQPEIVSELAGLCGSCSLNCARLRRNGYSLKMLVQFAEENGVKITPTALSGYMKKLGWKVEGVPANKVRREKPQPENRAAWLPGQFTMKPDIPL